MFGGRIGKRHKKNHPWAERSRVDSFISAIVYFTTTFFDFFTLAGQLGQRTPRFLCAHSLWSTIFTQAVIGWSKNMNKRMPSTMLKFIKKNVFLPLVLSNLGKFSYLCIANHHKNERKIQNCLF